MATDSKLNIWYVVQLGDSLSLIAKRFYNDEKYWPYLYQINQDRIGGDPNYLTTNLHILIAFPPGEPLGPPDPGAPSNPTPYTTKHGDKLWLIAENFYGHGDWWPMIYNQNRAVIGPDPNVLKVGIKLEIP